MLRSLRAPLPPLGAFLTLPPALPPHLVPRRAQLLELRGLILKDALQPAAVTDHERTVVVHGMAGAGKSVLAAALSLAVETRRVFEHGVVWLPIGRDANTLENLRRVGRALGDADINYGSEIEAEDRLARVLREKAYLIVLDDVWDLAALSPFKRLMKPAGTRSRLLVTTRDASLAEKLGAQTLSLDVLTDAEAKTLLANWVGLEVGGLPPQADEICQECGNLPLALAMIGAMLKSNPNRWPNALGKLREAHLKSINQQLFDYPYKDLYSAFEVSVDALDPQVRTRYFDLAVFREDTHVPEAAVCTLWGAGGLGRYECQDYIDLLVKRSLVRRGEGGSLMLHGLILDFLRAQASDLPALHGRLLDAYAAGCAGGGWAGGPNDGYFYENLSYHLVKSGRAEELYTLLTSSPDWIRRKSVAVGDTVSYLGDIEIALNTLPEPAPPGHLKIFFQLHTIRFLGHDAVDTYTGIDFDTLTWHKGADEARKYALLRSNAADKINSLLAIFRTTLEQERADLTLLEEAARLSHQVLNYSVRLGVLKALARCFMAAGEHERAFRVVSDCASLGEPVLRSQREKFVKTMSRYTRSIHEAQFQLGLDVSGLRTHLDPLMSLCAALHEAGSARAADALALALDGVEKIEGAAHRAHACLRLSAVLKVVGDTRWKTYLREGMRLALKIKDGMERVLVCFDAVATLVASGMLDEAAAIVPKIKDSVVSAMALAHVALGYARAGEFSQAVELASSIYDDRELSSMRTMHAKYLVAPHGLDEPLAGAVEEGGYYRPWVLRLIAGMLAEGGDVDAAMKVAGTIRNKNWKLFADLEVAQAMTKAGDRRAPPRFEKLLKAACAKGTEFHEHAISFMVQAGDFDRALVEVEAMEGVNEDLSRHRSRALGSIVVGLLVDGQIDRALGMLAVVESPGERMAALKVAANVLARRGDSRAEALFQEVISRARVSEMNAHEFIDALSRLGIARAAKGRPFPEAVFAKAEAAAERMQDFVASALNLQSVRAARAAALAKTGEMSRALEVVRSVGEIESVDGGAVDNALVVVAEVLMREAAFEDAIDFYRRMDNDITRARSLYRTLRDVARSDVDKFGRSVEPALELVETLQTDHGGPGAKAEMAAVLWRLGDARSEALFEKAVKAARSVGWIPSIPGALGQVAAALRLVGDGRADRLLAEMTAALEKEHQIFLKVRHENAFYGYQQALQEVAQVYATMGDVEKALSVAQELSAGSGHDTVCMEIADGYINSGQFGEALKIAPLDTLESVIRALSDWSSKLNAYGNHAGLEVLKEVTRIIGWERPGWDEVYLQL